MRLFAASFLVCALASLSAAAGQEVKVAHAAATTETGVQCYQRACKQHVGPGTLRACYSCCNTNCTNAVDCQDMCDKNRRSTGGDDEHNEQGGAVAEVYDRPEFSTPILTNEAACVILHGLYDDNAITIRWSIVVASERMLNASMSAEARADMAARVTELALDYDVPWRARITACNAIGESLRNDVLAVSALLTIVFDPLQHPDVRMRAEEILESF